MKHKYLLLFFFVCFSFQKGVSQNCTSLGCADNYGVQNIDATVSSVLGPPTTCYNLITYKQVFWQFFYSPSGGAYTQTFTPILISDPLDLDYIVFDMGISGPAGITCPVDPSGFTQILCNITTGFNVPTGPGIDGTVNTIAGHFYAIAVFAYQDMDASYSFNIGNPQISGVDLNALNCPGVLPVKLSSFDAKVNNCIVNLEWVAETESQFKNYEVEFSTDGRSFQTIATLASQGTGSNKKYSYNHSNPSQGKIFYRLKMKDIDGRFEYSKIIALNLACGQTAVFVYPNPVTDELNVNITNAQSDITTARLFDNTGRLVYSSTLKNGTNSIDMTKFGKGVYILRLKNNEGTQNMKIIK